MARIEKLEEDKKALSTDLAAVYMEAKVLGFDTPALKELVKLRRLDKQKLEEHEAMVELYMAAVEGKS